MNTERKGTDQSSLTLLDTRFFVFPSLVVITFSEILGNHETLGNHDIELSISSIDLSRRERSIEALWRHSSDYLSSFPNGKKISSEVIKTKIWAIRVIFKTGPYAFQGFKKEVATDGWVSSGLYSIPPTHWLFLGQWDESKEPLQFWK